MPPAPPAAFAWLSTLAYAVATVILVAGTFSLAQWLLARLYGETLGSGGESEAAQAAAASAAPAPGDPRRPPPRR